MKHEEKLSNLLIVLEELDEICKSLSISNNLKIQYTYKIIKGENPINNKKLILLGINPKQWEEKIRNCS